MSPTNLDYFDPAHVQSLWSEAISRVAGDPNTKQIGARGNFRINVVQALKATYYTAKLYVEGKVAIATADFTPWTLAKLLKGGYDAVAATLRTFYESLSEAEYVACIVLSRADSGLTPEELREETLAFVGSKNFDSLPFYLGLSDAFVAEARKVLETANAVDSVVVELDERGLVDRRDGRIYFKAKHFEWGFTSI